MVLSVTVYYCQKRILWLSQVPHFIFSFPLLAFLVGQFFSVEWQISSYFVLTFSFFKKFYCSSLYLIGQILLAAFVCETDKGISACLITVLWVFERERERECTCAQAGTGRRKGERENLKPAPHAAQSPTWGLISISLISWPWDDDLSWNEELDAYLNWAT